LRTYTITPEGLRRLLWRSARLSFAVTVLLIAIALRLRYFGNDDAEPAAPWVLIYLFGVLLIGTWLSARATRRVWLTYRLELSNDALRRTQYRMPEISLQRGDVIELEEMPGRGLTVRTGDSELFIFVPLEIDRYDELRSELANWAPVQRLSTATTWRRQWLGIMAAVAIVAWMVATMWVRNVAFVVPSAFAISVFLLWAFIAAQRSRHLDRRTKIGMYLVIFPILALTLKSTYLLVGLTTP